MSPNVKTVKVEASPNVKTKVVGGVSYRSAAVEVLGGAGGQELLQHLLHPGPERALELLPPPAPCSTARAAGRAAGRACEGNALHLAREQPKQLLCKDQHHRWIN